jgi:hypothetical protein
MLLRILNLLLVFGCSVTVGFAQTTYAYVLSGMGSQSSAGNASLSSTLGQPFASSQSVGGNILNVGFQQPQVQINTDSVPVAAICNQQNISIPYLAWGVIDSTNQFTAQLSDAQGNFANAIAIGTRVGSSSGFINASIPASLPSGTDYRIRVISSEPSLNGKVNPNSLVAGTCDSSQSGIGLIEQNGLIAFSCFPNPASTIVYFSSSKNITGKITIYDLNEQKVMELSGNGDTKQSVSINILSPGMYLAIYRDNEVTMSSKIIKQ